MQSVQDAAEPARLRVTAAGYPACMPLLLKTIPLVMFLYRSWRRLPARQRRALLWSAGRHGPKLATAAWRRARVRI
jgi:hypothetical protein